MSFDDFRDRTRNDSAYDDSTYDDMHRAAPAAGRDSLGGDCGTHGGRDEHSAYGNVPGAAPAAGGVGASSSAGSGSQDVPVSADGERLAVAVSMVAGVGLVSALLDIDVSALSADDAVTVAQQWERVTAFVLAAREQARAEVNGVLVAAFRDEEARIGERERAENHARVAAGLSALPRRLGAGFVPAELAARNELGAALRMAPRSIDVAIEHATELTTAWVPMHASMTAGEITEQHVKAIGHWLRFLPTYGDPARTDDYAAQCADVLDVVLPYATARTPGEAGRRTKQLVLTADPAGARQRRREAAEQMHGVSLTPTEPGTCELLAVMPLAHGEAIMSAVTTLAKDARFETAAGCITKGQRQAAALSTLILGDPGTITRIDGPVHEAKIRATINVIVPLTTITATQAAIAQAKAGLFADECTDTFANTDTLAGIDTLDALPGVRIGVEPVHADLIRDLLADTATDSVIRRLVTDPVGTVIDIGRAHYTPTGLQQRLVQLRDGRCRFPGCTKRAETCEIDHATAWDAGGATDLANLGALCKRHHQAKTHGGWQITESDRTGRCQWRSPLGRIYDHQPDDIVPPAPLALTSTSPPAPPDDDPPPF